MTAINKRRKRYFPNPTHKGFLLSLHAISYEKATNDYYYALWEAGYRAAIRSMVNYMGGEKNMRRLNKLKDEGGFI